MSTIESIKWLNLYYVELLYYNKLIGDLYRKINPRLTVDWWLEWMHVSASLGVIAFPYMAKVWISNCILYFKLYSLLLFGVRQAFQNQSKYSLSLYIYIRPYLVLRNTDNFGLLHTRLRELEILVMRKSYLGVFGVWVVWEPLWHFCNQSIFIVKLSPQCRLWT